MFASLDFPPIADASLDDLRSLFETQYRSRGLETFADRAIIPLPVGAIWMIYRGAVLLQTTLPEGVDVALGVLSPAMAFGQPLAALNPYWPVALGEVALLRMSMVQVEDSPVLARGLLLQTVRRLAQGNELVALAGRRRVRDRLRGLLHLLARDLGQSAPNLAVHDGWRRLPIRLTHHQLAALAQTTRVTVTRLLQEFQAEGWLQVAGDRHYLIDGSAEPILPSAPNPEN